MTESKDLFRDTPVRYLGYANEVGEAFRHFIGHKAVKATYALATCYVLADTFDKSSKIFKKTNDVAKTCFTVIDTLTWQMLASVIVPGFTINRICWLTGKVLYKTKLPKIPRQILVTAIGLGSIPVIIRPIDNLTDDLLDNTLRKFSP